MKKIVVLGGGMVGSAIARDLAKKHAVTVVDKNFDVLQKIKERDASISTDSFDIRDVSTFKSVIEPTDIVVSAVPGFMGFETLKSIIEAGKNTVDISFFPEDALALDALAKEKGVTAVVDCGVAPGMGNIILGYHNEQMDITHFECLVGGLPFKKNWPFNYKAPFSPVDVIEEYTRPARYVENGCLVTKEALSDCELIDFDGAGTLEAFNSDGLRSLIHTMPHIPNMKEKTLRYPGHVDRILALKKTGFFSTKKIKVGDVELSPLEFTSRILFDDWKLADGEEEFTVMRVSMSNAKKKVVYSLLDKYDQLSKTSSMARTTGYTATAVANLVLNGMVATKGVLPPELVGKEKSNFEFILAYLKERGVEYRETRITRND